MPSSTAREESEPLLARARDGFENANTRVDLYADGYDDPVYQAKARILNHAIQEIGMGRYQVG